MHVQLRAEGGMHGRTYPLSTAALYLLNAHKTCFQRAEGLQYSISQSSTCLKSSVTQADRISPLLWNPERVSHSCQSNNCLSDFTSEGV